VHSNCWIVGLIAYRRRYRRWARAGFAGSSPWLRLVPSESLPHWVPHMQLWQRGRGVEFVPLVRRSVAPWLVWTRLLFRGRVRRVPGRLG
jgi:hypothetical protein